MRWPKLKGKQERTSCFFRISLLLVLLLSLGPKLKGKQERTSFLLDFSSSSSPHSLVFSSLSSFFFCLVQESTVNDSVQYDFYDEGRYSEIGIMKTRRTVYQRKNTRNGSSFLVFHYHLFTKSNFRKRYSNSMFRREI